MKVEQLEGKRIYLPYASGATGRVNKVEPCPGHDGNPCDIVDVTVTGDGSNHTWTMTAVRGEEFEVALASYTAFGLWVDGHVMLAAVVEGIHEHQGEDLTDQWSQVVVAPDARTAGIEAVREVASR